MFRSTRLIHGFGIKLVYAFDGKPPKLKEAEIAKRRDIKEKATKEWREALYAKDFRKAFSKAVVTGKLTQPMLDDAKHLLELLGIPYVQAPSEGEAQAAFMASKGDVWACASRDYDSILFGAPRLLRFLTISGVEFLPSKGTTRPIKPELIDSQDSLQEIGLSREQLVDLAILIGTDFNKGVRGIGPKKALKLVRQYGSLNNVPSAIKSELPSNFEEIRSFFLSPPVAKEYSLAYSRLREEELYHFLVNERNFAKERVSKVVERIKKSYTKVSQADLTAWVGSKNASFLSKLNG